VKNLILVFLFIFTINNSSYSEEKIVYLDINFILNNSVKGKSLLNNLDILKKKNNEILKSDEKLLILEDDDIKKKKNILTKEELNIKIKNLNEKAVIFNKKKKKIILKFNKKKENEINKFLKLLNPIIRNYVEKNSISLVLDKKNILIGKKNYDITSKVLDIVNKEIK
jgi:Skp family chaperone for outer membrane proteins